MVVREIKHDASDYSPGGLVVGISENNSERINDGIGRTSWDWEDLWKMCIKNER